MSKDREIYTINIVVLGSFNPVIITPFWLASKGFIRMTEAETAHVELIHPDVTRFQLDWCVIEITQNRSEFSTNRQSHFLALRDLIVSIFSVLKETPVSAFGINHLSHFSLGNNEEYERFGYWLSPVEQFAGLLNKPKLQSVQYTETGTEREKEGLIRLIISPSDIIKDNKSVVFNCNHHFNIPSEKNAQEMASLLVEIWGFSFTKADNLNNLVWEKAKY